MVNGEFIEQLRRELPRLLREHPEVRHELWGLMLEAFPPGKSLSRSSKNCGLFGKTAIAASKLSRQRCSSGLRRWIAALKPCKQT